MRKKLYVRLGEYNLSKDDGSEIELKIERSIKHPKYNRTTVDNDIALLKYVCQLTALKNYLKLILISDFQNLWIDLIMLDMHVCQNGISPCLWVTHGIFKKFQLPNYC